LACILARKAIWKATATTLPNNISRPGMAWSTCSYLVDIPISGACKGQVEVHICVYFYQIQKANILSKVKWFSYSFNQITFTCKEFLSDDDWTLLFSLLTPCWFCYWWNLSGWNILFSPLKLSSW
jgi:hypothetical protein